METSPADEAPVQMRKAGGCCPPFDPAPWSSATVSWQNRLFVKDHVLCFMHVPLNIASRIRKRQQLVSAHGAPARPIMLTEERSPWGADLYTEVTRAVPGAQMEALSGTFVTRVYEGPSRDAGKWAADIRRQLREKRLDAEKIYYWYTACPRCAQAQGKNQVVVLAKLAARHAAKDFR